jgi:hypothetical protein
MSNVVIMVWMKHLDAGFGDLLRGTIYLYKLSQKMKFNLIVDIQLHPVSQFLVSHPHAYSDYVIQNKSKIIISINPPADSIVNQLRDHALSHNPNPILITTNYSDNHHESPSVECKQFMRSMLLPNEEFKTYFNDMCNAIKIPKHYSIMHFRLGDHDVVHKRSNLEHYKQLFDIVNQNIKRIPNLHIISDSVQFKQYLRRVLHPTLTDRIISTNSVHLSYPNSDINIKETLFDFMLLTNARIIETHSIYGWISGFVQWVSHIFNVPLINLKPKIKPMNFSILTPAQPAQPPMQPLTKPIQSIQPVNQRMKQAKSMQSMSSFMKTFRPTSNPTSRMVFSKM